MNIFKKIFAGQKNQTTHNVPSNIVSSTNEQTINDGLSDIPHDLYKKIEPNYSLFFGRLEDNTIPSFIGLNSKNSSKNEFSLTDINVDAMVNDATVTTIFTQRYLNNSTTPVEAIYKMPLAPTSAVNSFIVTYDDKVLKAKIKEKEAASAKYDDAIASGNQAFLVEKNSNGTFTTMIGNLPPTKEVTVSVSIISEIGAHLEDLHFGLHRYMFPRYMFNFTLDLKVQLSTPIKSINIDNCSTAAIDITGNCASIKYNSSKGVPMNIITVIKPEPSQLPSYYLEKSGDSYAIGLNYYPHLEISPDEVDQCSEFIFLIDCSGSMYGEAIAKAKRCLEILMRSLTADKSKFNIWLFGSDYRSLYTQSMIYNDETLEESTQFISKINADLGGTELLAPIKAILSNPIDPKYPRQIFILTDGQVSGRDELVDYVAKEANTTRIFTLGIGGDVDKILVMGLSKACRGYYELINDINMMETQVMSLMSIAMEPIIANIQVDWDGLSIIQGPKYVRPIFNHERMFIYGLLEKAGSVSPSTKKNIIITADGPTGSQIRFEIPIDFSKSVSGNNSIHTVTANLIIADLEEEEKIKKDKNKDEVVRLGKKFNLVSNHTSFIVVDESNQPTQETMKSVQVLPLTTNENSIDLSNLLLNMCYRRMAIDEEGDDDHDSDWEDGPVNSIISEISQLKETFHEISQMVNEQTEQLDLCTESTLNSNSKPSQAKQSLATSTPKTNNGDTMMDLIRSQKANGSWSTVSFKLPNKPNELSSLSNDVWVTLVVIATFNKLFLAQKTQWQQIIIKATKWVKSQLNAASVGDKYERFLSLAQSSI